MIDQFFDKALELPVGGKILIPTTDAAQMDATRLSLMNLKKKWRKQVPVYDEDILISRYQQNNKFGVMLRKVKAVNEAIVLDPDNNIVDTIKVEQKNPLQEQPNYFSCPADQVKQDVNRLKQAMREDGIDEEEIEEYFKGEGADG